jgi:prepilin-type N-terminal cleavage/methylation domain-containing protein
MVINTSRSYRLKNKKPDSASKPLSGFTIIEVVLVLAIAGLIFLLVFLALPGLQRSRRDAQRKSDMGK